MELNTKVKKIEKMKKNAKGITLVALVVTIIVLLILAGVAISLTIGQNGIITRAQMAVIVNENASVYEQLQFVIADYQMGDIENNTSTDILAKLKENGYVNNDDTVNVNNLMKRSMQTGNGSIANGDVYVLEQRQRTASSVTLDANTDLDYYLIYYGEDKTEMNLGMAFENKVEEPLYRLKPTESLHDDDIIYYNKFALIDKNEIHVEYGERVIIIQNGKTYFDGDVMKYTSENDNILDISKIYFVETNEKWNRQMPITIIAYKDGNEYSWNGYVSFPV